jgi:hypothetical protein
VGAISVLLLGVIAMVVSPSVIPWQLSQSLVVGLIIGLAGVGLLVVPSPLQGTMQSLLGQVGRLPVIGKFLGKRVIAAVDAVLAYSGKPGLIVWALMVSMMANGLSIMNIYLYALAVGADVSLAKAAVVAPVVLAVGLLPISLNGLGTIELTFVRGTGDGAGGGDPPAAGAAGAEPGGRRAVLVQEVRLSRTGKQACRQSKALSGWTGTAGAAR